MPDKWSDSDMRAPRLLIVDDNDDIRLLIARLFISEGYQVTMADDGASALDQIALHPPDLVLLDLAMPNLNGWETLRAVRAMTPDSPIPIVAITAHAENTHAREALHYGFDGFIAKPFVFSNVLEIIVTLLHSQRCGWTSFGTVTAERTRSRTV
jgi:CheY-like chemotaxis protein